MKTTAQWWEDVSTSPSKLEDWLKDQYYGEQTAAVRIRGLLDAYPEITAKQRAIINRIADDEEQHAIWVKGLLNTRGIPVIEFHRDKAERYWSKVLSDEPLTFSQICAIGHHAEVMRLDRINLLAADKRFTDIAEVFGKILPDELFHAKAFCAMSTTADIEAARGRHNDGLNALGLAA